MYSVQIIANQLEDPFGSDFSDLPLLDYQMAMNKSHLLLSPMVPADGTPKSAVDKSGNAKLLWFSLALRQVLLQHCV